MAISPEQNSSTLAWTLKKAVTTLAVAPQTESLTRSARMAYNVMILKAQKMVSEADGGYSAPLSEIVKGFEATTRDSPRIRSYIEQMCTTLVRWYPLSASDDAQMTLDGLAPGVERDTLEDARIFTLLSEARFSRRSGEQWVTWYFPPSIREMVIEPSRWAQLDIKEMAALSHYAGVVLYEICSRYKDTPGGLTNKAEPAWWVKVLKSDPESKLREWRKFKNETLKPALAEIELRTSLNLELIEHKKGRTVVDIQFKVSRKPVKVEMSPVDLTMIEQAGRLGIRERDLDALVDEFGEDKIETALESIAVRLRAQPDQPIKYPLAYLRQALKNQSRGGQLFDVTKGKAPMIADSVDVEIASDAEGWLSSRMHEISARLDNLTPGELDNYANLAREHILSVGMMTPAMQKRLDAKQYRSPMVWSYIKAAFAVEVYGPHWKKPTANLQA